MLSSKELQCHIAKTLGTPCMTSDFARDPELLICPRVLGAMMFSHLGGHVVLLRL